MKEFESYSDQVELRTPTTAPPGVTVSLTLTAHALESPDLNYAVVYMTVVSPVSLSSPLLNFNWKITRIKFSHLCFHLFSCSFRTTTCPYRLAQRHKSRLRALLFALSPAGLFLWLCQIQGAPALLPCSSSRDRGF